MINANLDDLLYSVCDKLIPFHERVSDLAQTLREEGGLRSDDIGLVRLENTASYAAAYLSAVQANKNFYLHGLMLDLTLGMWFDKGLWWLRENKPHHAGDLQALERERNVIRPCLKAAQEAKIMQQSRQKETAKK